MTDQGFDARRTEDRRSEQFRDRWSSFDESAGIVELSERLSPDELREYELFGSYDDEFLEQISPDVSVARWKSGAVLFEEGSYIDVAFFLVSGEVQIAVDTLRGLAGPIFDLQRTVMDASIVDRQVETRPITPPPAPDLSGREITYLASTDNNAATGDVLALGAGEVFGEIGALSGWPQSVTAMTARETVLVQIRLPALRALKRHSPALKDRLDEVYRERTLATQLELTPMLSECSAIFLDALREVVQLVSLNPGETAATAGEVVDCFYIVRSGFLKLMEPMGAGNVVSTYLSKGMTLGEVELLLRPEARWQFTAVAVGYVELLEIPREAFDSLVQSHPGVEEALWRSGAARLEEAALSRVDIAHSEFTEATVETGLVQGNSILAIDLNRCTRCDDCVRGCAATHGGRPRFVREGNKIDNLLVAKSCYHCRDPVCLVGCPTGAIRRAGVGELVIIEEKVCIGCSTCANNCPYDAIVMHETGETWSEDMVPTSLRGRERRVASKCDLCHDKGHEPACVTSCPHGCAFRVGSIEQFESLIERPESDSQ